MLESVIENHCSKYAKEKGWLCYKASSPGNRGQLDRVHFKDGYCFYIEYKATGKKATPKQRQRALELSKAGIVCRCFDSIEYAKHWIDTMTIMVDGSAVYVSSILSRLAKDLSTFY